MSRIAKSSASKTRKVADSSTPTARTSLTPRTSRTPLTSLTPLTPLTPPTSAIYSSRSAVIGFTRRARREGTNTATAAASISRPAADRTDAGSVGLTLYNWLLT